MLATQMLVGAGDEVVAVVPVWPNLTAQPAIMGANVLRVALVPRDGAWTLDLDMLLAAITPATRMLLVNAPNNPTGWTLTRAEQQAILARCREMGTWIVADEVYERLWFGQGRAAPSFLDIADERDRLIVVHSFTKSFLMTGWRLGWMVLPAGHLDAIGKLIEFNTSCAPVFVQRARLGGPADGRRPPCPSSRRGCGPAATSSSAACNACRACNLPTPLAACTRSFACRAPATIRWPLPSTSSPGTVWAWRRAWPSARRRKAGCAGASHHASLRASIEGLARLASALASIIRRVSARDHHARHGSVSPVTASRTGNRARPQRERPAVSKNSGNPRDVPHHHPDGRNRQGQRPWRCRHRQPRSAGRAC